VAAAAATPPIADRRQPANPFKQEQMRTYSEADTVTGRHRGANRRGVALVWQFGRSWHPSVPYNDANFAIGH
jgi:hypothetical protein